MKLEMKDFLTKNGRGMSNKSEKTKCMYLYQKTRQDCLDPTHCPVGDLEVHVAPPPQPYPVKGSIPLVLSTGGGGVASFSYNKSE